AATALGPEVEWGGLSVITEAGTRIVRRHLEALAIAEMHLQVRRRRCSSAVLRRYHPSVADQPIGARLGDDTIAVVPEFEQLRDSAARRISRAGFGCFALKSRTADIFGVEQLDGRVISFCEVALLSVDLPQHDRAIRTQLHHVEAGMLHGPAFERPCARR